MSELPVTEARSVLGRLVDEAMGGGEVVLTRHGRRVVQIVALPAEAYQTEQAWKLRENGHEQLELVSPE